MSKIPLQRDRAHPRAVIINRVVGWILPKREGGRLDNRIILGGRLDICRYFILHRVNIRVL